VKRKKQGSSLIVVIIVFMFLTTVSTAMLSMVLGNYKARISESKRVENLYASDSGLDVAYNVIGKNFDAAVKYGYYKVAALKDGSNNGTNNDEYQAISAEIEHLISINGEKNAQITDAIKNNDPNKNISLLKNQIAQNKALIEEDEEVQQLLINEEFKRAFNNFIETNYQVPNVENVPQKELQRLIEDHSYIDMSAVKDINADTFSDKAKEVVNFGIDNSKKVAPTFDVKITPNNINDNSPNHKTAGILASKGHSEDVQFNVSPKHGYYDIEVISSFDSENLEGKDDILTKTNERKLKASFKITVPEFSDIYSQEAGGYIQHYLATKDRAITVNGNMNLSEVSGFYVNNGDVYVGGTTPSGVTVSNRSYEKYSGGIMVYNSTNVNFGQDVVTRNTFNLRSGANVTVGGNLYGRNVYVGGNTYDSSDINNNDLNQAADQATLNINSKDSNNEKGKVVIDNDLGLKATRSNITINDFYGINDKNITKTGNPVDVFGNPVDRTKSSSSIIVNSNDNLSNIIIQRSAYIMGTAHINTNETATDSSNEYQTGESGAVKGNYIAYTVPLDASEKLSYYNPLQLLETPNVITKATHFFNYWRTEINKGHYPDTGGIQLPITKNSDGTVNTQNIHTAGALVYQIDKEKKVVDSTYNINLEIPGGAVYNAQAEFASKVYRFDQDATKPYDYDKTQLTDFRDLADTSKISADLPQLNNNGQYAIFNGEKELKIMKAIDGVEQIVQNGNTIEIHVSNKGTAIDPKYNLKAVIVSAGNVSIESSITINGCLIVGGDLNINGQNDININYDQGVIERVQEKNTDVFKAVFGKILVDDTDSANAFTPNGSASASYDLKYFLEKKLWQIIK